MDGGVRDNLRAPDPSQGRTLHDMALLDTSLKTSPPSSDASDLVASGRGHW